MVTLSFDDVSLTMNANDWHMFRNFMTIAIDSVPIYTVIKYQDLLDQIGMGYQTHDRLYKEKIVDESR
jgi:hypothetical protein